MKTSMDKVDAVDGKVAYLTQAVDLVASKVGVPSGGKRPVPSTEPNSPVTSTQNRRGVRRPAHTAGSSADSSF